MAGQDSLEDKVSEQSVRMFEGRYKVLLSLKEGPKSVEEIQKITDIPRSTIYKYLDELRKVEIQYQKDKIPLVKKVDKEGNEVPWNKNNNRYARYDYNSLEKRVRDAIRNISKSETLFKPLSEDIIQDIKERVASRLKVPPSDDDFQEAFRQNIEILYDNSLIEPDSNKFEK